MQGKVAIVTGGGSGIGRATCEALAARGARVVVGEIDEARGRAAAAALGGAAVFQSLDVGEESHWERAMASATDRFGGVDILVNNAGVPSPRMLNEVDTAEWNRVFRVNALGPFLGCKHALRAMGQRGGSIVNVASTAAIIGTGTLPAYASSKGAVLALTLSVAAYCQRNQLPVRCNSVLPGTTRSNMMRDVLIERRGVDIDKGGPEAEELLAGVADPSLVANAIVFLVSDEASRIQGAELLVDGMASRMGAW